MTTTRDNDTTTYLRDVNLLAPLLELASSARIHANDDKGFPAGIATIRSIAGSDGMTVRARHLPEPLVPDDDIENGDWLEAMGIAYLHGKLTVASVCIYAATVGDVESEHAITEFHSRRGSDLDDNGYLDIICLDLRVLVAPKVVVFERFYFPKNGGDGYTLWKYNDKGQEPERVANISLPLGRPSCDCEHNAEATKLAARLASSFLADIVRRVIPSDEDAEFVEMAKKHAEYSFFDGAQAHDYIGFEEGLTLKEKKIFGSPERYMAYLKWAGLQLPEETASSGEE